MSINFPNNPNVNDVHTVGNNTWKWNGTSWVSDSTFNGRVPAGTTSQRPTSPTIGTTRFNTDINAFEVYDLDGWRQLYGTIVQTPTAISPVSTDSDVATGAAFNLVANDYLNNLNINHTKSFWQVSTDPAFGSTVLDDSSVSPNLTSYGLDSGLDTVDTFYWRVRYQDSDGNLSDFSANASFNTVEGPPTVLGQSYGGGYYIGTTTSTDNASYYLVVAPNSTGCSVQGWKTTRTVTGSSSCTDGYSNTYGLMDNADHPAGNFTATRTIGGFSDWYMPSRDELNVLYVNDGGATNTTLPAGEGFRDRLYWSSTEAGGSTAWAQHFNTGAQPNNYLKEFGQRVRAVRRVPI